MQKSWGFTPAIPANMMDNYGEPMPDDYHTIMEKRRMEAEEKTQQEAIEREKRETRRFWITTGIASVAALASVAGIVLQLLRD